MCVDLMGKGAGVRRFPECVESGQQCPRTRLQYIVFALVGSTSTWLMCGHIVDPAFRSCQGDERSLLACYKVGIGSLWLTRLGDLLRWPWLGGARRYI